MSENTANSPVACQECGRTLGIGEEVVETDGGSFCTTCFGLLKGRIEAAVRAQGDDINYFAAALGAVGGGAVGAAIWWGFTVFTNIAFGLVAIVIGWLTARGVLWATGGKRAFSLQILSVGVAILAFFYASYLVNLSLAGLPIIYLPDWDFFIRVISLNFGLLDVVFLAIAAWEAWRGTAPMSIATGA